MIHTLLKLISIKESRLHDPAIPQKVLPITRLHGLQIISPVSPIITRNADSLYKRSTHS